MSSNIIQLLWDSFLETILMVGISGGLGAAIGIPLGVFLFITSPKGNHAETSSQQNYRHSCERRSFHPVHHSFGCHHSIYPFDCGLFHRYRCRYRSLNYCGCSFRLPV